MVLIYSHADRAAEPVEIEDAFSLSQTYFSTNGGDKMFNCPRVRTVDVAFHLTEGQLQTKGVGSA